MADIYITFHLKILHLSYITPQSHIPFKFDYDALCNEYSLTVVVVVVDR